MKKTINQALDQTIIKQKANHKPRPDHPWRKPFLQKTKKADISIWRKTGHFYFELT